ncbi:hypothetical protein K1719_044484 [Acacia pycnantha]|nr:hypothetical protein K1719_044484 [Acacia pycnantha]
MAATNNVYNSHQPSFPTWIMPHSIQPSFSLPSVASPENVSNSHQPSFPTWIMPGIPEHLYKNRLQEYAQASGMTLPSYETTNEGSAHAPKFWSTVLVGGNYYTSRNVFSVRKAAEQDAAKLAYEEIVSKIKDERLQQEYRCEESKLLDLSQQAGEPRHHHDGSSLKKKRRNNKKKANKRLRMDSV